MQTDEQLHPDERKALMDAAADKSNPIKPAQEPEHKVTETPDSNEATGKKVRLANWLQLVVGTAEDGLWWDSDRKYSKHRKGGGKSGWGIKLAIRGGLVLRPVSRPKYWWHRLVVALRGVIDTDRKPLPNKWEHFDPEYYWVLRFWFPILPFLSMAFGNYGFYIGFKEYELDWEAYKRFAKPEEVRKGNQALAPSISTRRTRIR